MEVCNCALFSAPLLIIIIIIIIIIIMITNANYNSNDKITIMLTITMKIIQVIIILTGISAVSHSKIKSSMVESDFPHKGSSPLWKGI